MVVCMFQEINTMRYTLCLLVGLAWAAEGRGQTSFPMLMDLRPIATQVGQTTELKVSSRYDLFGAYEVLVSGEGVTGEVVAEDPAKVKPPVTALKVKFKVEAGALPGVRDFRIATPRGVSTLGQLVVGMDPVVQEAKSNNTMALAQEVKLPTTFCGAIETAEDVD